MWQPSAYLFFTAWLHISWVLQWSVYLFFLLLVYTFLGSYYDQEHILITMTFFQQLHTIFLCFILISNIFQCLWHTFNNFFTYLLSLILARHVILSTSFSHIFWVFYWKVFLNSVLYLSCSQKILPFIYRCKNPTSIGILIENDWEKFP